MIKSEPHLKMPVYQPISLSLSLFFLSSKIEGIEHLHSLQKLNLAGNEIEHLPMWLGKKLRSLRILNLRKNKISSVSDFPP